MKSIFIYLNLLIILILPIDLFALDSQELSDIKSWIMQSQNDSRDSLFVFYPMTSESNLNLAQMTAIYVNQQLISMITEEVRKMDIEANCNVDFKISFGLKDAPKINSKEMKSFFDEMISIESKRCYRGQNIDKLTDLLMNDQFLQKSITGLNESKTDGSITCQKTSVALIGNSEYCFNNYNKNFGSIRILFSKLRSFNQNKNMAPVYLRESVIILAQKNDYTSVKYISMGRGGKLPLHFMVEPVVHQQNDSFNQKIVEALKN